MPRILCSLLLCCFFRLVAQTPDPPKVLRIIREDIKEGKGAAHQKSEAKFAQANARDKYPTHYLGMTSMTGPPQVWFLEAHDSVAAIADTWAFEEKTADFETLDALDAEYRSGSRTSIAVYRPDLSYNGTGLMGGLPKARYFNIITVHVRFEHDQEFSEIAKTAVEAAQKSAGDQPVAVYQVVSGMPSGTYLLLEPAASLKALDDAPARSRAMLEAMGDSTARKFLKSAGELIAGEESILFAIDPKMSYVSKELAAGDPEFWTPKPVKKPSAAK